MNVDQDLACNQSHRLKVPRYIFGIYALFTPQRIYIYSDYVFFEFEEIIQSNFQFEVRSKLTLQGAV